jgi:hypothetical protein
MANKIRSRKRLKKITAALWFLLSLRSAPQCCFFSVWRKIILARGRFHFGARWSALGMDLNSLPIRALRKR